MPRHLLIDGNAIGHAANSGTPLSVGNTPTQAVYGMMRTLHKLMALYGSLYQPTVLWDGASWRKLAFDDYKANRDKEDTPSAAQAKAMKDIFKQQTRMIEIGIQLLGINQVRAANMEADDLAGILVDRFKGEKIVLVTADRDWIQLVSPTVSWFDPINDRKITPSMLPEKYGVENTQQFIEMKALMGDLGDNIPGVGGVGEKGAVEFLKTYGSFTNFSNMCLDGTIDHKKLPKKYRELISNDEKRMAFSRNIKLMDLRTPERPAPINLKVTKGTPDRDKFEQFCMRLMFRSISKDIQNWVSVFPAYQQLEEAA